jgi:hypothetical protein
MLYSQSKTGDRNASLIPFMKAMVKDAMLRITEPVSVLYSGHLRRKKDYNPQEEVNGNDFEGMVDYLRRNYSEMGAVNRNYLLNEVAKLTREVQSNEARGSMQDFASHLSDELLAEVSDYFEIVGARKEIKSRKLKAKLNR